MSSTTMESPVLPAYAFRGCWWVWCDHCAQLHCHGAGPGHRVAHCKEPDSPYKENGYTLKLAHVVSSLTEARPGHAPLHGFLRKTRARLIDRRHRLLKDWMPRGRCFKLEFPPAAGRFVASLKTNTRAERLVWVDLGTCEWAVAGPDFSRKGRGLHTLAEVLFGVPADIAVRRLGEVIGADDPSPPRVGSRPNGAA